MLLSVNNHFYKIINLYNFQLVGKPVDKEAYLYAKRFNSAIMMYGMDTENSEFKYEVIYKRGMVCIKTSAKLLNDDNIVIGRIHGIWPTVIQDENNIWFAFDFKESTL